MKGSNLPVGAPLRSLRNAGGYWLLAIVVLVFCLAAVLFRTMLNSREIDWERAAQAAQSLTRALESEVFNAVSALDNSLLSIAAKLQRPDVLHAPPELRRMILFERLANSRSVNSVLVLDQRGEIVHSSWTTAGAREPRTDREYFKYHANNPSTGLYIGKPIIGRSSGIEVVTLSRRITRPDGSFGGVIVGSLRLDYLRELFRNTALGDGANITLVKTDGTVLTRWPFDPSIVGRDASRAELFKHLPHSNSGVFEAETVIDGVRRLSAYRLVSDLPLVVTVGQSTATIFRQWRQDAGFTAIVVVAFCGLAVVLAMFLYRELRRRLQTEWQLAQLAHTDALTGLHNRRAFDQLARREWLEATQNGTELAMVMLDIDDFKAINDTLGHRYGDIALQRVADAIRYQLRPNQDHVGRYGGDEFAILMPSTSAAQATARLQDIQVALRRICQEGDVPVPQLSMGVVSAVPKAGETFEQLMQSADLALYKAKETGRNQIITAPVCDPSAQTSGPGRRAA